MQKKSFSLSISECNGSTIKSNSESEVVLFTRDCVLDI